MTRRNRSILLVFLALMAILGVGLVLFQHERGGDQPASESDVGQSGPSDHLARPRFEGDAVSPDMLAAISGRVIDEPSGRGLADAIVCVHALGRISSERAMTPTCVRSDRAGGFELVDLVPGRYDVQAVAAEHLPASSPQPLVLEPAARVERLVLAMQPGGVALRGRAEDIAGGPIENAVVSTIVGTGRKGPTVLTDAEGQFELWVAPGPKVVVALAPGYALARERVTVPAPPVVLRLFPEGVIEGTVVHAETGEPIAGAMVTARFVVGQRHVGTGADAFSDGEGRFRLSRLHPGRYQLLARQDNLYGTAPGSVQVGLGEVVTGIVIATRPEPYVVGRVVVRGTDEGCPSGTVTLRDEGAGTKWVGPISDDGSVRIIVPAAGDYAVTIDCPGFVARNDYPSVVVGETVPDPQIWEVEPGVSISGIVVDEHGAPIDGADVYATAQVADGGGTRTSKSEADGSFTVTGLRASQHGLRAHADGFAEATADVMSIAPAEGVKLTLLRGGTVAGIVVTPDGAPVADIEIGLDGQSVGTRTDEGGRFEVPNLPPGFRQVDAREPGTGVLSTATGEPARVQVEVVNGERVDVRLEIARRDGRISGRVVDVDGAPISNAMVAARSENQDPETALEAVHAPSIIRDAILTETDGRFTIEKLGPGPHTVRALVRGGGDAVLTGVEPGSDIELRVSGTGSLTGRIEVAGAEQPTSFWVSITEQRAGWVHSELFRHREGEFRFDSIKAGTYVVFARSTAGQGSVEVTIQAGKDSAVVIELDKHAEVVGRVVSATDQQPLAGVKVTARPVTGGFFTSDARADLRNVSGPDGRFSVSGVATGRVTVHLIPEHAGQLHSEWEEAHVTIDVTNTAVNDIGTIELLPRSLDDGEARGDLGFEVGKWDHLGDQEDQKITVVSVDPEGPAAAAGLEVGDRIVSINGQDVTGNATYRYRAATRVRPGEAVQVGVEGAQAMTIIAR